MYSQYMFGCYSNYFKIREIHFYCVPQNTRAHIYTHRDMLVCAPVCTQFKQQLFELNLYNIL